MTVLLLMLQALLGLCLLAFVAYTGIAVWAARQWRRTRPALPEDPYTISPAAASSLKLPADWTPTATILKPVCGIDADAYESFASFCRLDYPADCVQLVFGALDANDPALELVRRLQTEFPDSDIAIVAPENNARDNTSKDWTPSESEQATTEPKVNPLSAHGHNLKVRNLIQMLPAAKHDMLVLCDSDMRVTPDYLLRIVAPFAANSANESSLSSSPAPDNIVPQTNRTGKPVGLVTCPYRGCNPHSFAAVLEALGIGADFIPSALVSRALEGVSFAFGSTIALPRTVLAELGGFEAIADELADDFRLGNGAAKAGYRVVLSDYVVEDMLGAERFGAMWARRLRWARTVRACRPAGYAGAFVTYGTALALLFLTATSFHLIGWAVLLMTLLVRIVSAVWIAARYTDDTNIVRWWWLLPISDLFSFALYVMSFCGSQIVWRGQRFRLRSGGRIEAIE